MTLENTLREKLSEWNAPPGRQELPVAAGGWTATIAVDRNDAVGCVVWELALRRDGTAGSDVSTWANKASQRITGLMEPLKVVEIDIDRKEAQIRSTVPLVRGDKGFYYELLLKGLGVAVLRRYQTAQGTAGREQVGFALTHEALAKVAGDLADCA
jgi:hypothetical protein